MKAAVWPRDDRSETRLLTVDASTGALLDERIDDLPAHLRRGDLLVVNDAATIPASLPARTAEGEPVEIRLAAPPDRDEAWAVLFGAGDWRTKTEDRPAPPLLAVGSVLYMGPDLAARVAEISPVSPRLVRLAFDRDGASLWTALYRHGRPVQYAYLREALPLWNVQTLYRGRPLAVEMPSAGRALTARLLTTLRDRGVGLARLTHGAGLSSTGDARIDAQLPLPEPYVIPEETAEAVSATRARGGRVVAVGTSVVRALESAVSNDDGAGRVRAGAATTALRIGPGYRRRVVDGLLTGVHEPGTSHCDLLAAFAPAARVAEALGHAEAAGYLGHEFGDQMLLIAAPLSEAPSVRPSTLR